MKDFLQLTEVFKVVLSSIVVAMCVASVQAQYKAPANERTGKPFTVSASLRGEYDDNINTASNNEEGSYKTILTPSIVFNYPMDQTLLSARYTFRMTHFADRAGDDFDFGHDFTARVAHTFTSRFDIDFRNRFTLSQESRLRNGVAVTRRLGDGIRNDTTLDLNYVWTDRISTTTIGKLGLSEYSDETVGSVNDYLKGGVVQNIKWEALPTTTAVASYEYSRTEYLGGIDRDFDSHLFLVGADHFLQPQWLLSGRVGAEYTVRDNRTFGDSIGPYGSLDTVWNYAPKSSLRAGYAHRVNLTDNPFFSDITLNEFTLGITHYITPKVSVSNNFSASFGTFKQGQSFAGTQNTDELTLRNDISIGYEFSKYMSIRAGYIHSTVDSEDANREYSRNQGYFAIRGSY